eukprot:TRINITY_DN16708_c0_g1_i1.p1 TRINITY_DN16708_c0_g1~~TRINITY_DN16708_c0_g1_i1.p1  ORF type:complete len:513 (-),score=102.21 TRINITY_DN16708_c0_g1_i1:210-1706(-)
MEEFNDALEDLDDLNQIKINVYTVEICKLKIPKQYIVTSLENKLRKSSVKELLPIMCLIDSLVKYSSDLANIFSKNITETFIYVYEKLQNNEEKEKMIKILNTWTGGVPFSSKSVQKLFDKYTNKRKHSEIEETKEVTPPISNPPIVTTAIQPNLLQTNPLTLLSQMPLQDNYYANMALQLLTQLKSGFVNLQNLNALINLIPFINNEMLQNVLRLEVQTILTNAQQSPQLLGQVPITTNITQMNSPTLQHNLPHISNNNENNINDINNTEVPLRNEAPPKIKNKKPKIKNPHKIENQIGLSFKNVDLKKKNNDAVNSLYDPNINRCDCGIRFHDSEKYKDHLSWHFKNRQNKTKNKTIYRSFFLMGDDWSKGNSSVETEKTEVKSNNAPVEEHVHEDIFLPTEEAGSLDRKCSLCTDKFVEKWKPAKESWILVDCIKINDKLFHNTCYKEFEADNKQNGSSVPNVSLILFFFKKKRWFCVSNLFLSLIFWRLFLIKQ